MEPVNAVLHGSNDRISLWLMVRRGIDGSALTSVLDLAYVRFPSMEGNGCERMESRYMKLVLTLLGVVLLVIAAVYVLVPADQLPGFFPGHEAGVTRVHLKHGAVSGVLGLVLLGAGVWMGRRSA